MAFQIVRVESNPNGEVISRRPSDPVFELLEHAQAMAQFDASRCRGDYGYDPTDDCWWGRDRSGAIVRFIVEPAAIEVAA